MSAFVFKALSVVFQYGMLLVLLKVLYRMVRIVASDVKEDVQELRAPVVEAHEAVLTIVEAREEAGLSGRRFAFTEEIAIGRGADNDIVIPDVFVSHTHARIVARGNQYVIEDLGSRNHTYVNDEELDGSQYLQPGDEIRIGFVTMKFER